MSDLFLVVVSMTSLLCHSSPGGVGVAISYSVWNFESQSLKYSVLLN